HARGTARKSCPRRSSGPSIAHKSSGIQDLRAIWPAGEPHRTSSNLTEPRRTSSNPCRTSSNRGRTPRNLIGTSAFSGAPALPAVPLRFARMDPSRATAIEIRDAVLKRDASAEEVCRAALQRATALNRKLNAFLEIFDPHALDRAREVDQRVRAGERPPLTGVPVALKDNMCLGP